MMSSPPTRISPVTVARRGACRPRIASAVTLLPDPDSPTIPRVRPGATANEIPSTARTTPSSVRNRTLRSFTRRYGASDWAPDKICSPVSRETLTPTVDGADNLHLDGAAGSPTQFGAPVVAFGRGLSRGTRSGRHIEIE